MSGSWTPWYAAAVARRLRGPAVPMLPLLATAAVIAAADAADAPALVTSLRGSAVLAEGTARQPAPAAPFLVAPGQAIDLVDGAEAVLLVRGVAFQVRGPKRVDPRTLHSPMAGAAEGALARLLERKVDTARASRGPGGLLRPVPGAPLVSLGEIRWACAPCADTRVTLTPVLVGAPTWTGHGAGRVRYDGPAPWPGDYLLGIGGASYSFSIVEGQARVDLAAAMAVEIPAEVHDPAALASIPAAVWFTAGLPTEALYVIDRAVDAAPGDAALLDLLAAYEARAGVRAPRAE